MNPFTLNYNSNFFCDRKNELARLEENIENNRNTLIHSPRRLGKSALIRHLFYKLEKKKSNETLFIDLFATNSLEDLIKLLAEKILLKYHSKNFFNGVKLLLKGLSPTITLSPDGTPYLGLNINPSQQETTLQELFKYLESRKKQVVIAFDEFQEIAGYSENAEAVLRTHIQNLSNVRFIFSGSSNHLLQQMFFSAKRPFYQSTEVMVLSKISRKDYTAFIKRNFNRFNKYIDDEAVTYLLDFSDDYTYYSQSVCNQAFSKTEKELTYEEAFEICAIIIENRKVDYQSFINLLSENQRKVLTAIANENLVKKPTAIDFITKNKLPSVSSVSQSLKVLEQKELIYHTNEGFTVYDVFLKRFLQRYYS